MFVRIVRYIRVCTNGKLYSCAYEWQDILFVRMGRYVRVVRMVRYIRVCTNGTVYPCSYE